MVTLYLSTICIKIDFGATNHGRPEKRTGRLSSIPVFLIPIYNILKLRIYKKK